MLKILLFFSFLLTKYEQPVAERMIATAFGEHSHSLFGSSKMIIEE